MVIVADENIPFVEEAFGAFGTVRLLPGREINAAAVRDARALLVRSVTTVDAALLDGSPVRFVGSATIGTDHVDTAYLRARNVAFAHAPGSNAESVVEYALAALLCLAVRRRTSLRGKRVGIVGCGNIGERLARRLPAFGVEVLKNDPPRAAWAEAAGQRHDFRPLADVLAEADVVTLHVPLVREEPHPTVHLLDAPALQQMKPGAWLLNTSRGAVVSNAALRASLGSGRLGAVVLDVWEGEPEPDPVLLRRVDLATPHIAGYSYDGKVQGTVMLYEALTRCFDLPPRWDPESVLAPGPADRLVLTPPDPALPEPDWLHSLVRRMYAVDEDDARMRRLLDVEPGDRGICFGRLRKSYPRRRAFSRHTLAAHLVPPAYRTAVAGGLAVQLGP